MLSRFAYCHRDAGYFTIRSPRSFFEVAVFDSRLVALIARLAEPQQAQELVPGSDMDRIVVESTFALLLNLGVLCEVLTDGSTDEDGDPALRQWEFHDLLFHARSRDGIHGGPTGGTYRFKGQIEPLAAVKPQGAGDIIPLHTPDIPLRSGIDFDRVLGSRRSIREHGRRPISLRELGELLHRSARIDQIRETDHEQVCRRPYASGGAMHELELYLVINRCDGLTGGLYHYRAYDHQLERLHGESEYTSALLRDAVFSTAADSLPQVLIVFGARFQRLSWKYQAIAYSLVLKHVGCLTQTMYLVATSMGLAPCAIGGGNSEIFSRAIGCSPYLETSVGEFIIGTRPDDSVPQGG